MSNIKEEIGNRIRDIRAHKNMSLEELSDRTGISPTPLSKLERGKSNVTIATLYRVSCALEVPLSVIVDITEAYIVDGTENLLAIQLTRYLKKLSHQQQDDIITFIKSISEWDRLPGES
ncbi:helix-turn-helix domain-containing protein [Anaerotruncus rubiinfantis]|uniref:helix-turn-helix domain-containing protein n=1 Tax=Anaerotruncus rubiinfantis TaxID=1720200 RepID=UPI0034A24E6F